MQEFQHLFILLLKDIKVELDDEFDRNFERKAFFDRPWKPAVRNAIGSLLMRSGALRKSMSSELSGTSIRWTSSLAYADIHNSGGTITVTAKMKKFFWYKFKSASGNNSKNLNPEALFWQHMALKPVGAVIKIPRRQWIGDHPQVHSFVKKTCDDWFANDVQPHIDSLFKSKFK